MNSQALLKSTYCYNLVISATLIVVAQNPVPFLSQSLVPDAVAPGPPGLTFTVTVNRTG